MSNLTIIGTVSAPIKPGLAFPVAAPVCPSLRCEKETATSSGGILAYPSPGRAAANTINHPIVFGVMAFDELASALRNVNCMCV